MHPKTLSRPQALRRLAEVALEAEQRMLRQERPTSQKVAAKASKMAGQAIDRLIDPSAPTEEREKGQRRLLKGPGEFRDIRARPRKCKA
jgi:hypothetical protein